MADSSGLSCGPRDVRRRPADAGDQTLIESIEDAVVKRHPQLGNVFVKAQTAEAFEWAKAARYGGA